MEGGSVEVPRKAREHLLELPALVAGEAGEQLVLHCRREVSRLAKDRGALVCEAQRQAAAMRCIGRPGDKSIIAQRAQQGGEGLRGDPHHPGKLCGRRFAALIQQDDHEQLAAGNRQIGQRPLAFRARRHFRPFDEMREGEIRAACAAFFVRHAPCLPHTAHQANP